MFFWYSTHTNGNKKAGEQAKDALNFAQNWLVAEEKDFERTNRCVRMIAATSIPQPEQGKLLSGKSAKPRVTSQALPGCLPSGDTLLQAPRGYHQLQFFSKARYRIPNRVQTGVVVTAVARRSPAMRYGLREGDVIQEVSRKRIDSVRTLTRLWKQARGKTLLLLWRRGQSQYVLITKR